MGIGKIVQLFVAIAGLLYAPQSGFGAWVGPQTLQSLSWGTGDNQLGFIQGESAEEDSVGYIEIATNDRIFINDHENNRYLTVDASSGAISTNTSLRQCGVVKPVAGSTVWCSMLTADELDSFRPGVSDANSGIVWIGTLAPQNNNLELLSNSEFGWFFGQYLYDSAGLLVTETTTRPIVFGSQVTYGSSVEYVYSDRIYQFSAGPDTQLFDWQRTDYDHFLAVLDKTVYYLAVDAVLQQADPSNGIREKVSLKIETTLIVPNDSFQCVPDPNNAPVGEICTVLEAYSEPIVSSDAKSIYYSRRTPTNFEIHKWSLLP